MHRIDGIGGRSNHEIHTIHESSSEPGWGVVKSKIRNRGLVDGFNHEIHKTHETSGWGVAKSEIRNQKSKIWKSRLSVDTTVTRRWVKRTVTHRKMGKAKGK